MAHSFYRLGDLVLWSGHYYRVLRQTGDRLFLRKYGFENSVALWTFCPYRQTITAINVECSIRNPLLLAVL